MVVAHSRNRWLVPVVIAVALFIADQITKQWIVQMLGPVPLLKFQPLIGDWFRLVYSQNTGVAFSLFSGLSPIFSITSILISIGIIYAYIVYLPNRSFFVQLSIGLILGGALGNTIDRIRYGYVIDFIQVGWWPVFNVADSGISVGAVILALYLILTTEEEQKVASPQDEELLHELLHREIPATPPSSPSKSHDHQA